MAKSGAIKSYLEDHAPELVFNLGAVTEDLRENPRDGAAWARFGLGTSTKLWASLPPAQRNPAIEALNKQIDLVRSLADLGISLAGDVLTELAVSFDAVPIIGGAISAVIDAVGMFVMIGVTIKGQHMSHSALDKNIQQWKMFDEQTNPDDWALGLMKVKNYEHYYKKDDRINGQKWRYTPCIVPSYRDAAAWGLGWAPRPEGKCHPGRRLTRKPKHLNPYNFKKGSGTSCEAYACVSSLFWPFWSPNHFATPIAVYYFEEEGYALADPNEFMIARQQALLADPESNMRVRGERLVHCLDTFTTYFRDKVRGAGGMTRVSDGQIPDLTTYPRESDPERFEIGARFDPAEEFEKRIHFYWDDNGMIKPYFYAPDLTEVGVPSFGPPEWEKGMAYTAAQLNTVVAGVKGFFVARAAMLDHPYVMKALLGGRRHRRFDPEILAAMKESAKGVS